MSDHNIFRNAADTVINKYKDKTAFARMMEEGSDENYSFNNVAAFIENIARLAKEYGLVCGDRAAILMPSCPWTLMTAISLMHEGITIVPVDISLPPEEINKILRLVETRAIFASEKIYEILDRDVTGMSYCFSPSEMTAAPAFVNSAVPPATSDPDNEVAAIIFSSGTTGSMKGIEITYDSVVMSEPITTKSAELRSDRGYLCILPFNHIAGFTSSIVFFLVGSTVSFIENADASKLQKGFQHFNPHYFVIVPKVYEVMMQKIKAAVREKGAAVYVLIMALMKLSGFLRKHFGINIGRTLFRSVRRQVFGSNIYGLGTGASPCKPETAAFFLDLGLVWCHFYAATETNVPIVESGVLDRYPDNYLGKTDRCPEIQIRINDPDENGIGEIAVKTKLIMKGYFREPELTAAAFDSDGYFRTGDYGYIGKKNELYVTGRIKESIVLQNGKKVSPADIDDYYSTKAAGYEIASRGILNRNTQCDDIHLFIEDKNISDKREAELLFRAVSNAAPSMYRLSGIHFIDDIPKTSVGKVKRFCLEIPEGYGVDTVSADTDRKNIKEVVFAKIRELTGYDSETSLTEETILKTDAGMDSLTVFELCAYLDELFGVNLENSLHNDITAGEIIELCKGGSAPHKDVSDKKYPLPRSERVVTDFKCFTKFSHTVWDMDVSGLENVPEGESFILCPNHECHFDGLWVLGNLDDETYRNTCCIAADYIFESKLLIKGAIMMNGIPVHRTGNTTTAMKRAFECLHDEHRNLLIHPEGTRTRSGKLGKFKSGAAYLAIKAGVKIIPVCINGAREIYPPHKKLPRLYDWKNHRKYKVQIVFCKPVSPENKTKQEMTEEVRNRIAEMKQKLKECEQ